jgi:hypothetical protein
MTRVWESSIESLKVFARKNADSETQRNQNWAPVSRKLDSKIA